MKYNTRKIIMQLIGLVEILVLSLMYYVCFDRYRLLMSKGQLFVFRGKYFLIGLYFIIAYIVFRVCESFRFDKNSRFDLSVSQCISCVFINGITWLQICLIRNGMITPVPLLVLTAVQFAVCILFTLAAVGCMNRNKRNADALLLSGSREVESLKEKIAGKNGLHVSETRFSEECTEALFAAIDRHECVIINDVPAEKRNDILKYCYAGGKKIFVVPKITDIILKGSEELGTFDTPVMRVRNEGPDAVEAFIKRAGDILVSVIAMIPGILIILIVTVMIKIEDGGPVFYTQERLTKGRKVFRILKFRSMVVDAEKNTGAVLATDSDPRITRTGRFLRSCRLDEFPQFINILKGEMSVVGPRPERVELAEEIERDMPEFGYRTMVKAGLTGYAQVYGKYSTTAYDKLRLDLIYVERFSLLMDLKLILMTPQIMFRKEASEGINTETEIQKSNSGHTEERK